MVAERETNVVRVLGALALLAVGGVHLQQYVYDYFSVIPTIGPLFLVNFIAATALGLLLLAPIVVRWIPLRLQRLAALAGMGVSAGAFVAVLISEYAPLFGFMESGYRVAVVLALSFEAAAITFLGVFLARSRTTTHRSASVGASRPGGANA